jgi:hypothetical protein
MRVFNLLLPLVVGFGFLSGTTPLLAAEGAPGAYLVFACDGAASEQRVLREQSATWIIQQTRAFATNLGRVVYRVPVGSAQLERLRLEMNLVPYRLEFSAEGDRWETLISTAGMTTNPAQFTTQGVGFTAAQEEAARASGFAWFRLRPSGESASGILRLRHFRLEVRGAELPPQFVRSSWWRPFAPCAAGALMVAVGVVPVLVFWRRWRITWRVWGGGAALWAVSVALKFIFAGVTSGSVHRWLQAGLPRTWADPVFWCYLGSLTGVF